MSADNTTQS